MDQTSWARNLPEDQVARRVQLALKAVGLAGFEQHSAFHLSFGEKKRVSIATMLAMDSEILALDEPTSNLEPKGRKDITQLLRRIGGRQIIVTHDLDLVRDLCERRLLRPGRPLRKIMKTREPTNFNGKRDNRVFHSTFFYIGEHKWSHKR